MDRYHLTDEEKAKIYKLREKDRLTISQLSERFHVHHKTIQETLENQTKIELLNRGVRLI